MNLAFVCVGAGRGRRFGGDKLAEMIGPRTVFATALDGLARAVPEAPIIVVVAEDRLGFWRDELASEFPDASYVAGAERRQDSVRAGVLAAATEGAEVVAVHDAARPLVDPEDARAVIDALGGASGSVLVSRVNDTVKRIDAEEMVVETVARDRLRLALTPQVLRVTALMKAWQQADPDQRWTDEAALLESVGMSVRAVLAHHPNPKVTTDADLRAVRAMVEVAS
jgi:2-C-methyl-D-erythritol 4-phosphate cytidylyltransferase